MGLSFQDVFMTRNNLSDQLSWLLADINLTAPHAPSLPPAREPIFKASPSADETVFFTPTSGLSPAAGPNNSSTTELYPILPAEPSPPSALGDGGTVSSERPPEVRRGKAVIENMSRLASKPNSRRPNLILNQEHILLPASTNTPASLSSDYSAFLAKNSVKKRTAAKKAPSESRSENVPSTPGVTLPCNRPIDTIDLTNESVSGRATAFGSDTCIWREDFASRPGPVTPSEGSVVAFETDQMVWREDYASRPGPNSTDDDSVVFGTDVMVWEEEAAWRPEPEPTNRGTKRKSDQISQPLPTTTTDDFPDIMDLLTDDEMLHTLTKRSPSRSPVRSKLKTSPSRTIPTTISVTKSPSKQRTNLASDIPSIKPPRIQLSPVRNSRKNSILDTSERTETKLASQPPESGSGFGSDVENALKPDVKSRRMKSDERVIQDSDDEVMTSPMYKEPRDTVLRSDSPVKRNRGIKREDFDFQNPSPGTRSPISSQSATVFLSARKPDLHKQSHSKRGRSFDESNMDKIPEDGLCGQAELHCNDEMSSAMLQLLLRQPSVIEIKRLSLEERLRQNKESFKKSLQEGTTEPRERLRRDKEQLMRQQASLDTLTGEYRSYEDLVAKKDALIARISEAYEHDLNTEDDEKHLQELDGLLKNRQESLKEHLLNADIRDPAEYEDQLAHGIFTHRSGSVVQSTQNVAAQPTVLTSLSRESSQLPGVGSTQVIMQTQVTARLDAQQSITDSYLSETHHLQGRVHPFAPLSPQRLARSEHHSGEGAKGSEITTSTTYPVSDIRNYEGDDHLDAHDFMPNRNLSQTTGVALQPSAANGQKTLRNEAPRQNERYESDYSDGIDISEFAEEIECRPSASETAPSTDTRTVLPGVSSNLELRKGKLVVKKKPSVTVAPISPEQKRFPWYKDVRRALKDRFRMSGFRHNQLAAINATLAGKDAFILMPTGGGKSLCYQLPAVVTSGKTSGITVVVTPLLSLMQDQVEHLKALNITAKAFNGDTLSSDKKEIMGVLKSQYPEHQFQLLYVTPEMINKSTAFLNCLDCLFRNKKLARLVIDEAHCVSQWGHDFRPDYKQLGSLRERFPGVPLMALTATATQNVIMDVKHNLCIEECEQFTQSFNRPNLYYEVRRKEKDNTATIADLINSKYPGKTGIVYTLSRKSAETIAQKLRDHGIASHHYHASVDAEDKVRIQRDWQQGKIKVVVATIAFGMGIDKPDVRFVIHQSVPKSLEGYYQETGRAGRDGENSECYLFFNYGDVTQLRKLIADGDGNEQQKERQRNMLGTVTAFCDNQSDCRRVEILRYFGETFSKAQCNATCDNCKSKDQFEQKNFTNYALAVLQIVRSEGRITLAQCTDYLMGKRKKTDFDHDVWDFHGVAKNIPKHEVHRVVDRLLAEEALREENVFRKTVRMAFQYFRIGRTAHAFLANGRQLWLTTRVKSGGSLNDAPKAQRRLDKPAAPATRKEPAGQFTSTLVSSPTRKSSSKNKGKAVANHDEDSDEYFGMHSNGYARDGFVVGDEEVSDNDFERMPAPLARRRKVNSAGPISHDARLSEKGITDIHKDVLESFFDDVKRLEEKIRASSGRRQPLFSQIQLREMGLRWTVTLDQMRWIANVDKDVVNRHGGKFLPLIQRYHRQYQEIMGLAPEPRGTPYLDEIMDLAPEPRGTPCLGEIVDLVSSDEDDVDAIEDGLSDEDDEEGSGQTSGYFEPAAQGKTSRRDMDRGYQYHQQEASSSSKSRARSSGDGTATRGKNSWRNGKKPYASRRSSGGKFAGVRKKSNSAKRTSGSFTSRNSGTSSRGGTANTGSKNSRAQGVGFDGIGLMDH
ncbi:hypothetical protein GGS21DRAFT_56481 [Xylaria nigripes]|nr:hypothetical protein GGS21DRAFT_56481 [Xylaria nigripes]